MNERGLYLLFAGIFAPGGLAMVIFYRQYTDWEHKHSYKMILPSIRKRIEEGKEQRVPAQYRGNLMAGILLLVTGLVLVVLAFAQG